MAVSPLSLSRTLYRTARWAVTLTALALLLGQILPAQFAKKSNASKGPRALGLLELAPNGKAHLVPVAIRIDGQFYDASDYKAAPVPMALESGTVYEAVRSGVSQGLFTVSGALATRNRGWIGAGTWQDSASLAAAAAAAKKKANAPKPVDPTQEIDAPPTLHRGNARKPSAPPAKTEPPAPPAADGPPSTTAKAQPPAQKASPREETNNDADPNRPVLRRGKQPERNAEPEETEAPLKTTAGTTLIMAKSDIRVIPAISDAAGPDPLPFTYSMKPDEEHTFRSKMLALAGAAVLGKIKAQSQLTTPAEVPKTARTKTTRKSIAKVAQPSFEDVELHVFDLSNNNEPVLVLTATAKMPSKPDMPYFVTLVEREDIYDELHQVLANVTDPQHLDVVPRVEFIDAVDADGDGRAELLFRRISDSGSAFSIYRVIGNQLWPLFEGALGR